MMWWSDLSDSELRARLRQRGIDDAYVALWVAHRELEKGSAAISKVLGDEP